jgi:hypothetical protein
MLVPYAPPGCEQRLAPYCQHVGFWAVGSCLYATLYACIGKMRRSSKKRRRMKDQDPSEDWVHSNHCGTLSDTLHDRAQANCCQELSKLSATPSSSLPGENSRQWLHNDQPGVGGDGGGGGGVSPVSSNWTKHQIPSTSRPRSRLGSANSLSAVFLLSLSVYDIGDIGLFDSSLPASCYGLRRTSCRSPGTPSPSLWCILGNYGRRSQPWLRQLARCTQPALPVWLQLGARRPDPAVTTHWAVVGET